jgi:hypothetical protein
MHINSAIIVVIIWGNRYRGCLLYMLCSVVITIDRFTVDCIMMCLGRSIALKNRRTGQINIARRDVSLWLLVLMIFLSRSSTYAHVSIQV